MNSEYWVKKHPRTIIIIFNLVLFGILELLTRFLMKNGVIPYVHLPTSSETSSLYADLNPSFGVWRYPNRSVQHSLPCFNVNYTSNSYGARDAERPIKSKDRRAIVLGDSFVDGFGVELQDRMTNIADKHTAEMDFLNFGIAGNFGPVQQWLLYKDLASNFDHEEVHIFFLPSNDFDENDPGQFPANRYRPYLRKNKNSSYEVYYTVPFSERVVQKQMSRWRTIRRTITNNIYLLNAIRQLGLIFEHSEIKDEVGDIFKSQMIPSYEDYTQEELEYVQYAYEQIIKLAGNRRVRIFMIPREIEFMQPENRMPFKLVKDMEKFDSRFENVEVHDLFPVFVKYAKENNISYEEFFLKCDSHWSPLGNRVAGEYVASVIQRNI